jgi:AraC family transcriptional regulator
MPALAKPHEAHPLFLSQVALAMCTHMAAAYGGIRTPTRNSGGGLTRWQEQRAKELMVESVNHQISLRALADECSLSVRHFTRAFRTNIGMSPHRWLTLQRIDVAKKMVLNRDQSLAAVALSCGFADQSHFTRVFARMTGFTPNAWRATHGSETTLASNVRSGASAHRAATE